jgi:predicted acetyltransferase
MVGREIREYGGTWSDPDVFARFVEELRAEALESTPRPEGYVPSTTFWYVDGDEYIGRLAIRHRLTPSLLDVGGHIGYDIRASRRREGHGTAMVFEALRYAYGLGIDPALVTCDEDNVGSQKVIEACGGVYEDVRGGKLRYWIPTKRL